MAMTIERAGEIALKIIENRAIKHGMNDPRGLRRELGNLSKEINVPIEELSELTQMMLPKIIGAMYGASHVGITIESE